MLLAMRISIPSLLGFASLLLGATHYATKAGVDPTLRITLRLDGKEHEFVDGQTLPIEIGGKPVQVQVAVHPNRRFEGAGVSFDFPRAMSIEHQVTAAEIWTIEGPDCTLMVQQFAVGSAEKMVMASFPKDAPPPEPCVVRLGGKEVSALRGRKLVAGVTFEVTAIPLTIAGKAVVLVLQDCLGDSAHATAESHALLELLDKTFAFTKKAF
jgi:hypothetical protein